LLTACGGDSTTGPTSASSTPELTPVATSIELSDYALAVTSLGAITQLTATVKDQNGATMANATVAWAISDNLVATVSAGRITSIGPGVAIITAASGPVTVTGTISVTLSTDGLWTSITSGGGHACGVTTGGDGYCWGYNEFGQLG
jgi:hypothetical protein